MVTAITSEGKENNGSALLPPLCKPPLNKLTFLPRILPTYADNCGKTVVFILHRRTRMPL